MWPSFAWSPAEDYAGGQAIVRTFHDSDGRADAKGLGLIVRQGLSQRRARAAVQQGGGRARACSCGGGGVVCAGRRLTSRQLARAVQRATGGGGEAR